MTPIENSTRQLPRLGGFQVVNIDGGKGGKICQGPGLIALHTMEVRETSDRSQGPKVPQEKEGYILAALGVD